jgi:hypothetical protein
MPKLAHSIKKPVLLASPGLFGDPAPRLCILVDIEPAGLWVSGEGVSGQLAKVEHVPLPHDAIAVVFVPFEQVGYVWDPAQFAHRARGSAAPVSGATPGDTVDEAHSAARGGRSRSAGSKRKASKGTR